MTENETQPRRYVKILTAPVTWFVAAIASFIVAFILHATFAPQPCGTSTHTVHTYAMLLACGCMGIAAEICMLLWLYRSGLAHRFQVVLALGLSVLLFVATLFIAALLYMSGIHYVGC